MRLRFGGFLVAAILVLGGGSVSLAQEVTPEFVQETIVKANQGTARAYYNLGVMYINGEGGGLQNMKTAKEWFGKACDRGLQLGCDAYRELNEAGH